jgi:damage-control phosphatase, subfamily I
LINNKKTGTDCKAETATVAVLGASSNPERYSYKALALLKSKGYKVMPVHPALSEILGEPVCRKLSDVPSPLDTLTVYVPAERSSVLREDIFRLQPRRVIFNPGTENQVLAEELRSRGIEALNACTIVMLNTDQFESSECTPITATFNATMSCIPCLLRQAGEALDLSRPRHPANEELYREIIGLLAASDWRVKPPFLSLRIQRMIRERTGCDDPYKEMKAKLNREALRILPEIIKLKPEYMHVQEAAIRVSIGGNALDAGAKTGLQMSEAMKSLRLLYERPLQGDWAALFTQVQKAERILFLADNAGEIVFDRFLLEMLPPGKVTVAVRGAPVINDATMEDAIAAGILQIAHVISNGSYAPGTILEDCSPEFRDIFEKSDLVIAKGQGNYETLGSVNRQIVFLLQVKCPMISERAGASIGTMIVRTNPESAA